MTPAVLDRPGSLFADAAERSEGPAGAERPAAEHAVAGGRLTLEELLNSALHEACTNGSAECPVCHAGMNSTRAGAREAKCGGCGSRLS